MINNSLLRKICPLAVTALIPLVSQGREVARFSMENNGDRITETVTGNKYAISSLRPAENVAGAQGQALRFDGYSTYIDASLSAIIPSGSKKMTASVWLAIETYPIVEIDVNTPEQVAIASCLDESAKTGFGFFVGFDGKYSFKTYAGGWPLELKVDIPLAQYEWINLTAVLDTEARTATLYNNGEAVATSRINGTLAIGNSTMRIGRSFNERFMGPFCLTSFNGLIDDIAVWDEALSEGTISSWKAENKADLTIPAERFADDPMRPAFHGLPGANWTNETHGLTYSNGRYHLFFQKNANGPYMSRLHWGHLSSENLYDWIEERIALTPGEWFDIKGCWSGCVFSDPELTQGKPSIIYTAVDYGKAVIAQATPKDANLIEWTKAPAPIIDGRPGGLSDDFRDPYFFRSGSDAYIIVGSSKGGVGTTTLHHYNLQTKTWSNDGKTFFTGKNAASCGTFWEMPNLTKIGDKWLFTVTPQNTASGVAALYWVGTINADGTFKPDRDDPTTIELQGFARDGFGLLSPSIYQRDGKTIALGIVPDKLPGMDNYELGYAHAYSLPREWTLDSEGKLCQKPYSGLTAMRQGTGFSKEDFSLNGSLNIEGVSGRALELLGEFTVGSGKVGFTLLDDGSGCVKVYYDGATNELVVDCRSVNRLINDAGTFDGLYHSPLPRQLAKEETVKLNVVFDHSILDIFINDTWASSVRIFAKGKDNERTTVFSEIDAPVRTVKAWNLNTKNGDASIGSTLADPDGLNLCVERGELAYKNATLPAILSVYNLQGMKMMEKILESPSGRIATDLQGMFIATVRTTCGIVSEKIRFN